MKHNFNLTDQLICHADNMLRTVFAPAEAQRPSPAGESRRHNLSHWEQDESRRLMRVNHTGEVCAQALYQGQSLTARSEELKCVFEQAADEENDHLAWCEQRIKELNGRTSRLNPLFYLGSYSIGALVGLLGDRASASFLAETEYQVAEHLDRHLDRLPVSDTSSRKVVEQMRQDELQHAKSAEQSGATAFSETGKGLMRAMGRLMTGTSYWI